MVYKWGNRGTLFPDLDLSGGRLSTLCTELGVQTAPSPLLIAGCLGPLALSAHVVWGVPLWEAWEAWEAWEPVLAATGGSGSVFRSPGSISQSGEVYSTSPLPHATPILPPLPL